MKSVRYSPDAIRALRRHGNIAARLRRALAEYAGDPAAHANNVTRLVGTSAKRMRVGDFRILFEEGEAEIMVTKIGSRGSVYG